AVAAFAAYAFSWMRFWGRDWIFLALVGLLAVPLQVTFIPLLTLAVHFGLTSGNNFFGLNAGFLAVWIAHTGYGLPFAIYLLANFFRVLPQDLFESAEIDGARSEEHTSELQSRGHLVCRLLLEKKKNT